MVNHSAIIDPVLTIGDGNIKPDNLEEEDRGISPLLQTTDLEITIRCLLQHTLWTDLDTDRIIIESTF